MPDATGAFRFTGIAPGKYQVMARSLAAAPVVHWAVAEVMVDGNDVSGLELLLQPGLRLSGRVAFEARTLMPPDDLAAIQLRLIDPSGAAPSIPPGRTRPDGTVEFGGIVPGAYGLMSSLSDRGWWLRSAMVDGRDIMDSSLEFGATGDVTGMVVTFSHRRTELSGTLQGPSSVPAPDYFVVVFPRDRGLWRAGARRIQSTRPATDGTFVFKDLPSGDYFIGALTDLEPSDLADVGFLESLIPASVPIHLDEGEKKTQSLQIRGF